MYTIYVQRYTKRSYFYTMYDAVHCLLHIHIHEYKWEKPYDHRRYCAILQTSIPAKFELCMCTWLVSWRTWILPVPCLFLRSVNQFLLDPGWMSLKCSPRDTCKMETSDRLQWGPGQWNHIQTSPTDMTWLAFRISTGPVQNLEGWTMKLKMWRPK